MIWHNFTIGCKFSADEAMNGRCISQNVHEYVCADDESYVRTYVPCTMVKSDLSSFIECLATVSNFSMFSRFIRLLELGFIDVETISFKSALVTKRLVTEHRIGRKGHFRFCYMEWYWCRLEKRKNLSCTMSELFAAK